MPAEGAGRRNAPQRPPRSGVETHARLDGQRTQTQRLEDIRNLRRTVDADEKRI
jgi:hypothetical protein